ncbi:hypothetical protein [Micromonospora sp. b486]|uniref:hypothetical protein n=1 Tax=Micromonospora sp. b486 TaxID=3053986 RepID=UPI00259CFBD3|nr:hypothetical protein [Micromonospora sp. b486]MDM4784686.1 hypothetical protein [Micromonospora sp. b486]
MLAQALVPAVLGRAVEAGLAQRDPDALVRWSLALLGLGLVQAVAGILRHRCAVHNWLGAAYRTVQVTVDATNRLGGRAAPAGRGGRGGEHPAPPTSSTSAAPSTSPRGAPLPVSDSA